MITLCGWGDKLVNSVIVFISQTTLLMSSTFLLGSLILTVLFFSIYLFPSSAVFENVSLHWKILIMLSSGFPSNSTEDAPFHCITFDSDSLYDHLRDISWENVFKLVSSAVIVDFCGWVLVGIDVYVHRKYQAKPDYLHGNYLHGNFVANQ